MQITVNIFDNDLHLEIMELASIMGLDTSEDSIETSDLLICDNKTFRDIDKEFLLQKSERIILISSETDEYNIINYLGKHGLNHIIGYNANMVIEELRSTIRKIQSNSLWGLKQYMDDDAHISSEGINESHRINETIDQTIAKFDFDEYFESPKDYIKVMANELVTNALYNGVATRDSLNVKDAISRKENIFLKGSEHILFSMSKDENALGVSVQDTFGKLTRDKVVDNLVRSFTEKTPENKIGGAGLGFYMVYNHANQIIVNYKRNKRTEVIALIDYNKRFKKYRERITSFHFHEEV